MAVTNRRSGIWWSRLHFVIRFLGLTGLLACGVGAGLVYLQDRLTRPFFRDIGGLQQILLAAGRPSTIQVALWLLAVGGVLAVIFLLVEVVGLLGGMAGKRGAFGFMSSFQMALALALLVCVNWYSFKFHARTDWTRQKEFTLPKDVQLSLRQLRGETTIIVYQRHKTFGVLNDKPDAYDYAAERKVVEKVKDLVAEFREFGPQFNVVTLDVEEEGFQDKLAALVKLHPELKQALDRAPENSIFFLAEGRVQRLSFNEFYQLDKKVSEQAKNLVLLPQGKDSIARKILEIEEKKPRIGILVIHEWLTSNGPDDFGQAGLKKALMARGFEVKDIILKKWTETGPPEPAVLTYDESKFERLDSELAELDADIKSLEPEIAELDKAQKRWKASSLDELTKDPHPVQLPRGVKVSEALRKRVLGELIEPNLTVSRFALKQAEEQRKELKQERAALNVDNIAETRRITDLKAKLERALADCDLVYVPRMTIRNLAQGDRIAGMVHKLEDAQVDAIRDYLKLGKPLLACLGPTTEHPSDRMRMAQIATPGPDRFENLLQELGVKLNSQTILYNAESKSFAERRTGLSLAGSVVELPPVDFAAAPKPSGEISEAESKPAPNPLRNSMLIASDSLGSKLDIKVPHARPVSFEPPANFPLRFDPDFMVTNALSWNEDQPFPTRERTPRYEPTKGVDPNKGKFDEKRRGPFPIGVAFETRVPASWYADPKAKPAELRMAVLGNGGIFVGQDLSPAKELLLVNTCNWLLGRDNVLPKSDGKWSYPRVELGKKTLQVWSWAGWLAMPILFAYFGLIVLLLRRLR